MFNLCPLGMELCCILAGLPIVQNTCSHYFRQRTTSCAVGHHHCKFWCNHPMAPILPTCSQLLPKRVMLRHYYLLNIKLYRAHTVTLAQLRETCTKVGERARFTQLCYNRLVFFLPGQGLRLQSCVDVDSPVQLLPPLDASWKRVLDRC